MKTEVYHDELERIRSSTDELHEIDRALRRVGLNELSAEIAAIRGELASAARKIDAQLGEDLSEQVRNAEANSGAMLSAVLAGCELEKRDHSRLNTRMLKALKSVMACVRIELSGTSDHELVVECEAAIAEAEIAKRVQVREQPLNLGGQG